MTTGTPNFEEFQSYSKQQLEALSAASATLTKGLQELAVEFDRLLEEGICGWLGRVRETSRAPAA